MNYYRVTRTGRIISESRILVLNDIYGYGELDSLIRERILKPFKPTVIDLLEQDQKIEAVRLYKDIHNCTLREAFDMVNLIIDDMNRFRRKK